MVLELVLSDASVAVMLKLFVLEAFKSTEAFQVPPPVVVATLGAAPPVMRMVELASAVPNTVIGLVVVE